MKAHELLAPEGAWTQDAFARDRTGKECPFDDRLACAWCLEGAVAKCYPNREDCMAQRAKLKEWLPERTLGSWNDNPKRTQGQVVALLKELDI